jgi:hypothetical protein
MRYYPDCMVALTKVNKSDLSKIQVKHSCPQGARHCATVVIAADRFIFEFTQTSCGGRLMIGSGANPCMQ